MADLLGTSLQKAGWSDEDAQKFMDALDLNAGSPTPEWVHALIMGLIKPKTILRWMDLEEDGSDEDLLGVLD